VLIVIFGSGISGFNHFSSDYEDIDSRYGTLEDWDRLLEGVHARGMKLMYVPFEPYTLFSCQPGSF